jgi:hypothetical protein
LPYWDGPAAFARGRSRSRGDPLQLRDLLDADLEAFIEKYLRLEQVDHVTLGHLLRGFGDRRLRRHRAARMPKLGAAVMGPFNSPDYRARRTAMFALRAGCGNLRKTISGVSA